LRYVHSFCVLRFPKLIDRNQVGISNTHNTKLYTYKTILVSSFESRIFFILRSVKSLVTRQLTRRQKSEVLFSRPSSKQYNGLVNVDGPQTIPKSLHPNRTSIPQTSTHRTSLPPNSSTITRTRGRKRYNHRLNNNQTRNSNSRINVPRPFRTSSSWLRQTN